jgi:hypothetical protein
MKSAQIYLKLRNVDDLVGPFVGEPNLDDDWQILVSFRWEAPYSCIIEALIAVTPIGRQTFRYHTPVIEGGVVEGPIIITNHLDNDEDIEGASLQYVAGRISVEELEQRVGKTLGSS